MQHLQHTSFSATKSDHGRSFRARGHPNSSVPTASAVTPTLPSPSSRNMSMPSIAEGTSWEQQLHEQEARLAQQTSHSILASSSPRTARTWAAHLSVCQASECAIRLAVSFSPPIEQTSSRGAHTPSLFAFRFSLFARNSTYLYLLSSLFFL